MVVDWLRECYSSRWRLFKDSDAYTSGYYYFSPPNTPHYPGWHNLGARVWLNNNNGLVQSLGEDLTFPHRHRTGVYAGEIPAPRFVGSKSCIADGEPIAEAAAEESLFHGYPLECFVPLAPTQPPPPPRPRDWERLSTWDRCTVARFWIKILDWSYANAGDQITKTIEDFCEGPVTVTFIPPAGLFVGITVARGPNWTAVCLDGTRDFQQLAMQGLRAKNGPTDFGIFSTNPLWYQCATYVHVQLFQLGITTLDPIFFTGHSYGAAVALICAARYRFGNLAREIRYLTFGCPKIGDRRLAIYVNLCAGASLRNHNDVVTAIPPDLETLLPVAQVFPLSLDWLYENWERPPTAITQNEDGAITPGGDFELGFKIAVQMIARVIDNQPFSRVAGHGVEEYLRRILLRCDDVQWPIDEQVNEDLETDVGMGVFGLNGGGLTVETHFTPGTFTWTAPIGVTRLIAFMWAAGGTGGGGAPADDSGGGGGGGGAFLAVTLPVTPGETYVGRVGDGAGAEGIARNSKMAGDDGSFGIAEGGDDGQIGNALAGGAGGAGGGTSTAGDAVIWSAHDGGNGGAGSLGTSILIPGCGGGGGASGGFLIDGFDGLNAAGGAGGLGGDNGGDGGNGGQGANTPNDPDPGFLPGGGGGGWEPTVGPFPNGADGQVYLAWIGPPAPLPGGDLLLEDGTGLLLEDGTSILLE